MRRKELITLSRDFRAEVLSMTDEKGVSADLEGGTVGENLSLSGRVGTVYWSWWSEGQVMRIELLADEWEGSLKSIFWAYPR